MNVWVRVVLFAAAVCVSYVVASPLAFACLPPEPLMEVDATVPADGAVEVGLSPVIAVQLKIEESYDFEQFRVYDETPFHLSLSDSDGNEVASEDVVPQPPYAGALDRALLLFEPGELETKTLYRVTLERGGKTRRWSFTTGGPDGPTFEPLDPFVIDLDSYFADRPVDRCCPIEMPGECPTCFTIGDEPVPALNVAFEPLQHPAGTGAFAYSVQVRADVDGAEWEDMKSFAVPRYDSSATVEVTDRDFLVRDTCLRLVARSVLGTELLESNERCRRAEDFGEEPEPNLDPSRVMCEPEDGGDTTDDDIDVDGDDGERDVDTSDGSSTEDGSQVGWEFDEDPTQNSTDEGCGCGSAQRSHAPGSVVLLLLIAAFGLRRRLG